MNFYNKLTNEQEAQVREIIREELDKFDSDLKQGIIELIRGYIKDYEIDLELINEAIKMVQLIDQDKNEFISEIISTLIKNKELTKITLEKSQKFIQKMEARSK
jgi:hypothetical protein